MNNNQFGMNSTNNQMNSNNFNQQGQSSNFNQNGGYNQYQQPNLNQNMNTFNESTMPTNNPSKKDDKKTKLIIIIVALIVIIPILGILISRLMADGIFNDTTKKVFVDDAKTIFDAAQMIVNEDNSNPYLENSYAPKCKRDGDETTIPFSRFEQITSFSINYDESSFVKVKAILDLEIMECNYEYYIYLTDGTYSIGTASNPVLKDNVTIKSVTK